MQIRLRGQEELSQSFKELLHDFLAERPPEERLRGIPIEDRLRGLEPEDLRGLSAASRQRLRELLDAPTPSPSPPVPPIAPRPLR